MRFKLLKPIFEFKVGYILYVTEKGFGQLGRLPWGYEIPYFIMKAHTEWFEQIDDSVKSSWEEIR